MTLTIYTDENTSLNPLKDKTIAVIGYGAQGRAQARMLAQSGVSVVVGVRPTGPSYQKILDDGLSAMSIKQAAQLADIVHILIPDETQKEVYEQEIKPYLKPGNILSFSHGFNIVFGRIEAPDGVGVIMVAPKAPGTEEYRAYQDGFGVPALVSVHKNGATGQAKEIALAMAKAMHFTRAGVVECSFAQETYEDLFGEQAVLCGGVSALIKNGFEVLVERGYPPELAYFECLHEMKLIVDLIVEGGLARMWEVVSNTAEFGGHTRASRIINPQVKQEMHKILDEVENGSFAKEWMNEYENNKMKNLLEYRKKEAEHPIEVVGAKIRSLFKKEK